MKLLIGIAITVILATTAHADTVTIQTNRYGGRSDITITRHPSDTGKPAPQPSQTYIQDSNGNLRDPVTGWPKAR
jgi:hypothetical protein